MKNESQRGICTSKIAKKYKITSEQLRLLPYLHHCLINNMTINPQQISAEEFRILQNWENKGLIKITSNCSYCTQEFYLWMSKIFFEAYILELPKEKPPKIRRYTYKFIYTIPGGIQKTYTTRATSEEQANKHFDRFAENECEDIIMLSWLDSSTEWTS